MGKEERGQAAPQPEQPMEMQVPVFAQMKIFSSKNVVKVEKQCNVFVEGLFRTPGRRMLQTVHLVKGDEFVCVVVYELPLDEENLMKELKKEGLKVKEL